MTSFALFFVLETISISFKLVADSFKTMSRFCPLLVNSMLISSNAVQLGRFWFNGLNNYDVD